jgi:light-harvesting complex 1 alpha chain
MHKIWTLYHPHRVIPVFFGGLALLAFVIHFILLSSHRYSWIENGTLTPAELAPAAAGAGAAAEMAPLPPAR